VPRSSNECIGLVGQRLSVLFFKESMMLKASLSFLAVFFSLSAVSAQDLQPTCKGCPGTYIPNSEFHAYVQRAIANHLTDQQVRAVDAGKSNIAVGIVYRPKLDASLPNVAEHDQVSEVYHVIDGSATFVTGPDLVGKNRRPADSVEVRTLNGPGNNAASIRNGATYHLKAGDVVIIPAGTGHWFTKVNDHITYLIVRIDPDKVTKPKDEAASKAYLAAKP
jgi:mannose-6-phosphate isomerase-like protein (cupin superfamily)